MRRITLKEAERFHGHLGPWLVLGVLAGETALRKLKCKKYFAINVRVWGAGRRPKSCLIDGLQLSTGATYGKGNIRKLNGPVIKMEFCNGLNHRKITLRPKNDLVEKLEEAKSHRESEALARKLYRTKTWHFQD